MTKSFEQQVEKERKRNKNKFRSLGRLVNRLRDHRLDEEIPNFSQWPFKIRPYMFIFVKMYMDREREREKDEKSEHTMIDQCVCVYI